MDSLEREAKAKQRFLLINAMRIAGVLMIMLGIAVAQGLFDLPQWTAWLLVGLGMVETFVTPQVLARMWSTKDPENRGHDGER